MDPTASSLLSSLTQLTDVGRKRAREERESQRRAARRVRVDSLVAENRRRKIERERAEAQKLREAEEKQERLELEARLQGRRDAEAEIARIAATHDARMREMALVHDLEEQQLFSKRDHRAAVFGLVAAAFALVWITTVVIFANQPAPSHLAPTRNIPAAITAEAGAPAPTVAVVTTPAPEPVKQPVRRRVAPPRKAKPAPIDKPAPAPAPPPPAPTCDDASGDPCCAFGEIIC